MITEYFSLNKDGNIASNDPGAVIDLRDDKDVLMIWPRKILAENGRGDF